MLDVQTLRDHPDRVRQAMRDKGAGDPALVDDVLKVDEQRRKAQTELQEAQTELNASSKQIGQLMREGKRDEAQALIERTSDLKERVKKLEDEPKRLDEEQRRLLLEIPNLPHPSVPVGASADDNEVVFEWGEKQNFEFEPKPHWELAEQHGLIDFERGAKVTGAGFPFYVGKGARLQRALVQFFLDLAAEADYVEMQPPLVVNEASAEGTGQIPDKEAMMYETEYVSTSTLMNIENQVAANDERIRNLRRVYQSWYEASLEGKSDEKQIELFKEGQEKLWDSITANETARSSLADARRQNKLFLIPTAEVPVTNYFRNEILGADDLPTKFAAYTPCFRREAGSYGKDVRGLNRLHQFDKVELVQFVHPDQSYDALEALREDAERAVQKLNLPYKRLLMCTGDMGVTQAKKYDLEVWSAGQDRWLEVSSVSNFEAYQARRANIRFRPKEGGKTQFVHTLNGSGLALPRIVAALLENNQRADGSIAIPDALRPYTGFDSIG